MGSVGSSSSWIQRSQSAGGDFAEAQSRGGELNHSSLTKPCCVLSHYKALGGSPFLFSIIPRPGGHAVLSLKFLWLCQGSSHCKTEDLMLAENPFGILLPVLAAQCHCVPLQQCLYQPRQHQPV